MRLSDAGIGPEKLDRIIDDTFKMYANAEGVIPGARTMTRDDMRAVLTKSL
jgi:hypothetical protein